MIARFSTLRGELHCFACARYLGDFEVHRGSHGDVRLLEPEDGALAQHAVRTPDGLRCSRCGGRAILDYVDIVHAAAA